MEKVYTKPVWNNNFETSCVVCIDISKEKKCFINKDYRISVNISSIDLSLGKIFIHQLYNNKQIRYPLLLRII